MNKLLWVCAVSAAYIIFAYDRWSLPSLPEKLKPEEAGILAYVRYPTYVRSINVGKFCMESSSDAHTWIEVSCTSK